MSQSTTFAIGKVTIPTTELMVIIMAEFHMVNLVMVVITIMNLRVCCSVELNTVAVFMQSKVIEINTCGNCTSST